MLASGVIRLYIVIQSEAKDLGNINKKYERKRTKKGEKEPHSNEHSFLSPPVLLKKKGGHKIRKLI